MCIIQVEAEVEITNNIQSYTTQQYKIKVHYIKNIEFVCVFEYVHIHLHSGYMFISSYIVDINICMN